MGVQYHPLGDLENATDKLTSDDLPELLLELQRLSGFTNEMNDISKWQNHSSRVPFVFKR